MERNLPELSRKQVDHLLEIVENFVRGEYNLGEEQKLFLRKIVKKLLLIKIEILKEELLNGTV